MKKDLMVTAVLILCFLSLFTVDWERWIPESDFGSKTATNQPQHTLTITDTAKGTTITIGAKAVGTDDGTKKLIGDSIFLVTFCVMAFTVIVVSGAKI